MDNFNFSCISTFQSTNISIPLERQSRITGVQYNVPLERSDNTFEYLIGIEFAQYTTRGLKCDIVQRASI
jgi:hypothetical protein